MPLASQPEPGRPGPLTPLGPGSADRPLRDTATHRPMRPCRLSPLPPGPVACSCLSGAARHRCSSIDITRGHATTVSLCTCVTSVGLAERIAIDRSIESKILPRASHSVSPSVSASFLPASSSAAQAGGPGRAAPAEVRWGSPPSLSSVAVVTDSVPVSRDRDAAS